jgi:hypothetical protein
MDQQCWKMRDLVSPFFSIDLFSLLTLFSCPHPSEAGGHLSFPALLFSFRCSSAKRKKATIVLEARPWCSAGKGVYGWRQAPTSAAPSSLLSLRSCFHLYILCSSLHSSGYFLHPQPRQHRLLPNPAPQPRRATTRNGNYLSCYNTTTCSCAADRPTYLSSRRS